MPITHYRGGLIMLIPWIYKPNELYVVNMGDSTRYPFRFNPSMVAKLCNDNFHQPKQKFCYISLIDSPNIYEVNINSISPEGVDIFIPFNIAGKIAKYELYACVDYSRCEYSVSPEKVYICAAKNKPNINYISELNTDYLFYRTLKMLNHDNRYRLIKWVRPFEESYYSPFILKQHNRPEKIIVGTHCIMDSVPDILYDSQNYRLPGRVKIFKNPSTEAHFIHHHYEKAPGNIKYEGISKKGIYVDCHELNDTDHSELRANILCEYNRRSDSIDPCLVYFTTVTSHKESEELLKFI